MISAHAEASQRKRTADDGCQRPVLGDQTGCVATGGKNHDSTGLLLRCSSDCGNGYGLGGIGRTRLNGFQLVVQGWVTDGGLGNETSLGHHENYCHLGLMNKQCYARSRTRLDRVASLGSFSRQHHAISTIEDRIGDIANFCTRGPRVVLNAISITPRK